MRYAMIMAGGSGTRLWPMSRAGQPKQLIPFVGGKSLLQVAADRLDGLVDESRQYICAGEAHREATLRALPGFTKDRFLSEPKGRDTLNAVAFAAAVIAKADPEAVIAVFTADHIIEPIDEFQQVVAAGFELAEKEPSTLVTFGISPTHAATGYGYLQLGRRVDGCEAFVVNQFREKPNEEMAKHYIAAGPDYYLWNSGMFVWKAGTLLDCIERYEPENHAAIMKIADAWGTPKADTVVSEVYPTLKKISVDYAVMEPASRDTAVSVAAFPMHLKWLDVGSWPSFAETCETDVQGNAVAAAKTLLLDTHDTLVASGDDGHLIATIGCEHLIIIHTPDATLICPKNRAEDIKKLHAELGDRFADRL